MHLVKLGMVCECQKFIATETVQKVITDLWNNAVIFSPNKRLFSGINMGDSISFSKTFLSYSSFGLLSIFFQSFDWESNRQSSNDNNDQDLYFHTSSRLYKSEVKYYTKEIEYNPKKHALQIMFIKYKNFVCSPKSYFVVETVNYLIFFICAYYTSVSNYIIFL